MADRRTLLGTGAVLVGLSSALITGAAVANADTGQSDPAGRWPIRLGVDARLHTDRDEGPSCRCPWRIGVILPCSGDQRHRHPRGRRFPAAASAADDACVARGQERRPGDGRVPRSALA